MPKALKKGAARLRKVCFSEEELNMLADTLAENGEVVFGAGLRRPAQLRKKEIWEEVACKVSAVGTTPRTIKDVRKHWDDLRLRVWNILAANRSQGMATGGGGASPIKMTRWEETCVSTIGMEAIEGVGDMERGVPSSADGGTQSDSEAQDPTEQPTTPVKKARGTEGANRPSTSRGTVKPGIAHKPKTIQEATAPMRERVTTTTPTSTTTTQEPVAEGSVSTASSTVGEAAATAPLSDGDAHSTTPDLSPPSTHNASSHEMSAVESWPGSFSPTGSMHDAAPLSHAASTTTSVRDRQEGITLIQQRQEELTALVTQHISEGARVREEFREYATSLKGAIESSSTRICDELAAVRQVLTRMADALEALRPAQVIDQPGTSLNAISTQTSPLRRSARNLRRSDMGPPDVASEHGM
ncbi:myb-related transcription factor, partner of profilin-like [Ambystoma mexicanum]|uniref:myb-related transcription factor, partner of profilin-like n=1 Tax=Ambystoma mexicanum TaxID=8296 RepID=UPI0037E98596